MIDIPIQKGIIKGVPEGTPFYKNIMQFCEIGLSDRELLSGYLYKYSEGSCQHSFLTFYSLNEKYGDRYAIEDGFLFVFRSNLNQVEGERNYLFPLGDTADLKKLKTAVEKLLKDAASHGKRACFNSVTGTGKQLLTELFPGRFEVRYERDLGEYIYSVDKIASLPGKEYYSKRRYVKALEKNLGDRIRIEPVSPSFFSGIAEVKNKWFKDHVTEEFRRQLEIESRTIERVLMSYEELDLSGIVILIDGKVEGFIYGCPLNDDTFDASVGKVNRRQWKDLYPLLYREFARRCAKGYRWLNWEEDLGSEGLRKMKLSYRPDHLIEKYIVTEI